MNIAVVGAGNVGAVLVRHLAAAGHTVRVATRRGPEALAGLAAETGTRATTLAEVADGAQVIILAVPFAAVATLRDAGLVLPVDAVVVDAGNYVPHLRDAAIVELDQGGVESLWTQQRLGHPVVKAFNTITAASLKGKPKPAGAPGRVGLPVAGDDAAAKAIIVGLADGIGFDGVDAGRLDESWRQQPGTPVYTKDLSADAIAAALAAAEPGHTDAWRQRLRQT